MQTIAYEDAPERFHPLLRRWLRERGPAGAEARSHVVTRPEELAEPHPERTLDVRAELCDRLEAYQAAIGAPDAARQAVARLRDPRALTVMTGQQPGLLGGALMVSYKTATAIALARRLEARWQRPVIPVFWNHSDDADVDEIRRLFLIDRENQWQALEADPVPPRTQIASVDWRASLPALYQRACALLPTTQFLPEVRAWFDAGVGEGPAHWFSCVQTRIFGRYGLVMFEPRLGRDLWRDVVASEIEQLGRLQQVIAAEAERLVQEGFAPPLDPATVASVFRVRDGLRCKLRRSEAGIGDDGGTEVLAPDALAALALRQPELFSPGVALRPICQDRVFPTATYVGGPAEVAYLTQLRGGYAAFGVRPPALMMRLSATLVEPKIRKVLDKFKLSAADTLRLGQRSASAVESTLPAELADRFAHSRRELVRELRSIRALTEKVDPNLERHYRRFAGKVMQGLREVRRRTAQTLLEQQGINRAQIDKVVLHLTPRGQLQERMLPLAPYLCLFGPALVDRILAHADAFYGQHALVDLS